MDEKILKYIGTYIIAIIGALFVAIGVVLGEFQLKPQWIGFLVVLMGATETLLIALIRIFFKVPNEEPTVEVKALDDGWNHITVSNESGSMEFYQKVDPDVSNTT